MALIPSRVTTSSTAVYVLRNGGDGTVTVEMQFLADVELSDGTVVTATTTVPAWASTDYDSLYIVKLTYRSDGTIIATFQQDREGLDGQPTTCPF